MFPGNGRTYLYEERNHHLSSPKNPGIEERLKVIQRGAMPADRPALLQLLALGFPIRFVLLIRALRCLGHLRRIDSPHQ